MRHRSQLPYAAAGLQLRLIDRRFVSFIQIMQTSQTKHLIYNLGFAAFLSALVHFGIPV